MKEITHVMNLRKTHPSAPPSFAPSSILRNYTGVLLRGEAESRREQGQPQRRRHRAGSPARRDRRALHRDAFERDEEEGHVRALRRREHVHRERNGSRCGL